jgi:hypothetical protein
MARREVSLFQAVVGLTLFATIALPIVGGEASLLDLLLRAAQDNLLGAIILLVMLGSPQLFGLAVALAWVTGEEEIVRGPLTWLVAILQGLLVLFGVNLVGAPVTGSLALLGFALVTGLYLPYAAGEAAASQRGRLSLRWYMRWGALLIVGFGLWVRLQMVGVVAPAIDVAIGSAALLLASLARRDPAVES